MLHLEVETKFELNADDFEHLKSVGRVTQREEQLNVYYDAGWKLAESSTTLRIRLNSWAHAVLCLKIPVSVTGRRREMREIELALREARPGSFESYHPATIDVSRQLPREFSDYLRYLGVDEVQRVGWVRNTRLLLEFSDAGYVELDHLKLPDGSVLHEVEIEAVNDWTRERLAEKVCQLAPAAVPSRLSKFQRFRLAATRSVPVSQWLPKSDRETAGPSCK